MGNNAVTGLFDLGDLGFGEELDAALFQALAGEAGNLRVFDRQDLRQEFDHRHLCAQRAIEGREFDADGARAHDDERLGHFGWLECFEIGPYLVAIRLDPRQHTRTSTRSDNDVLGLVSALAQGVLGNGALRLDDLLFGGRDLDLTRLGDGRFAPDDVDLVLLHEELDAIVHLRGNGARTLDDAVEVEAELFGG